MRMSIMQIGIGLVLRMRNVGFYGTVFGSLPNPIKGKSLKKGKVGATSGVFTAVQGDSESTFAEKPRQALPNATLPQDDGAGRPELPGQGSEEPSLPPHPIPGKQAAINKVQA